MNKSQSDFIIELMHRGQEINSTLRSEGYSPEAVEIILKYSQRYNDSSMLLLYLKELGIKELDSRNMKTLGLRLKQQIKEVKEKK